MAEVAPAVETAAPVASWYDAGIRLEPAPDTAPAAPPAPPAVDAKKGVVVPTPGVYEYEACQTIF